MPIFLKIGEVWTCENFFQSYELWVWSLCMQSHSSQTGWFLVPDMYQQLDRPCRYSPHKHLPLGNCNMRGGLGALSNRLHQYHTDMVNSLGHLWKLIILIVLGMGRLAIYPLLTGVEEFVFTIFDCIPPTLLHKPDLRNLGSTLWQLVNSPLIFSYGMSFWFIAASCILYVGGSPQGFQNPPRGP